MAAQTFLISGASTGFGALAARALAKQGHTVFAGMYSHDGNIKPHEDAVAQFSKDHNADLRAVPMDLLDQDSVDSAVRHVLSTSATGSLDTVIHNAGHMNYGPAESFTADQYLQLYNVNVVGAQRLNQAVLPHMRARRRGHLIWISSSSVFGGKPPFLGGYFAAKAGMDTLANSYARELAPWGIESTIVSPGIFTSGTNHFTEAMHPGRPEVRAEYARGPGGDTEKRVMEGMTAPGSADPAIVADVLVELAAMERGKKPLRLAADPADSGGKENAAVVDKTTRDLYRRLGLTDLLTVSI